MDDLLNDPAPLADMWGKVHTSLSLIPYVKVLNELREGILSDEISRVWTDEEILERIKSDIKRSFHVIYAR